ncbi:hypothetical protein ACFSCX_08100 [Bacillus salitolerans]|uniref:Type II secretion system protein n=1 Tax=Bacillus salitolerans TaxID=1437434 RepID=A0ABW4LPY0_9BACI
MRNCKGVSLLESVVASFLLFSVILLVMPQLYFIVSQRENIEVRAYLIEKLNDELFRFSLGNQQYFNKSYRYNGIRFQIVIDQTNILTQEWEGCVSWENEHNKYLECETIIR